MKNKKQIRKQGRQKKINSYQNKKKLKNNARKCNSQKSPLIRKINSEKYQNFYLNLLQVNFSACKRIISTL